MLCDCRSCDGRSTDSQGDQASAEARKKTDAARARKAEADKKAKEEAAKASKPPTKIRMTKAEIAAHRKAVPCIDFAENKCDKGKDCAFSHERKMVGDELKKAKEKREERRKTNEEYKKRRMLTDSSGDEAVKASMAICNGPGRAATNASSTHETRRRMPSGVSK